MTPGTLLVGGTTKGGGGSRKKVGGGPRPPPRISPNIKPLLPEGSLHSPTHALLLASKSNYQNLVEGTHLPGVNYPASLSTGLTSKRTSHKVAEQGRRNRINDALREMQTLVPKASKGGLIKDDAEGEDSGKGGGGGSKAATVEMANLYIRGLQAREREMQIELEGLRREKEELVRRLAEKEGVGGTTSADGEGEEGIKGQEGGTVAKDNGESVPEDGPSDCERFHSP